MGKTFKDRKSRLNLPRVRIPMKTGTRVEGDRREAEEDKRLYRETWWDYLEGDGRDDDHTHEDHTW